MLLFHRVLWWTEGAVAILLIQRIIAFFIFCSAEQNKNRRAFINRPNNTRCCQITEHHAVWIARFCYEQLTQSRGLDDREIISSASPEFAQSRWPMWKLTKQCKIDLSLFAICKNSIIGANVLQYLCFSPLDAPAVIAPEAPTEPLCQTITHLMLMTGCRLLLSLRYHAWRLMYWSGKIDQGRDDTATLHDLFRL